MNKDFTDFEYEMQNRRDDGTSDSSGVSVGGGSGALIDAKPFPGIDSGSDGDSSGGSSDGSSRSDSGSSGSDRSPYTLQELLSDDSFVQILVSYLNSGLSFDESMNKATIDFLGPRGARGVDWSPGSSPVIWNPNPNSSPADNMSDLVSWIYSIIQGSGLDYIHTENISKSYVSVMSSIARSVKKIFEDIDVDGDEAKGAIISMIEKVSNLSQNYIDQLFTQALSYQSWYAQQEYNSPENQLKRLEQAGLSSSFIFGNYSNSASSPAAVSSGGLGGSQMSGAGDALQSGINAKQQYKASMLGNMIEGAKATAELINVGVNSSKTLAEAENIRQLTPLQVASAIQNFDNVGVQMDYFSSKIRAIENDNVATWFRFDIEAAEKRVENAQINYRDLLSEGAALHYGSEFINEEKYKGFVRTKTGELVETTLTLDELTDSLKRGGKDTHGNTVFSEDDMRAYADIQAKYKNGIPGVSSFEVGGQAGVSKEHKTGSSSTDSHESTQEISNSTKQSKQGFDGNTQTLQIGSSTWTRTNVKRLVNSREYIEIMNKAKQELQDAKDNYYHMTNGERSRSWQNYQMYLDNKAQGLKWSQKVQFTDYLKSLNQPKVYVPD